MCDDRSSRNSPNTMRLTSIIEKIKHHHNSGCGGTTTTYDDHNDRETPSSELDRLPQPLQTATKRASPIRPSSQLQTPKIASSRKRRLMDTTTITNNNEPAIDFVLHNNNNNNNVKKERLSPGTSELSSSRSRSVTPSSVLHPDTPPANDNLLHHHHHHLHQVPVNYSDFMRSLAAKYNNTNPNEYFSATRNGVVPPALDAAFKPSFLPGLLPNLPSNSNKDVASGADPSSIKSKSNSFTNPSSVFSPLIDMSATRALLAMAQMARDDEVNDLLEVVQKMKSSSPLDLSSAAAVATAPSPATMKRAKLKTPSSTCTSTVAPVKRAQSESPTLNNEEILTWTVDDVYSFVSNIDICAEYAQNFRDQRIDGSGLSLLTEEHLRSTLNMKLGPALKLISILVKKTGTCSVCLHCTHCHSQSGGSHNNESSGITGGNSSDSAGPL